MGFHLSRTVKAVILTLLCLPLLCPSAHAQFKKDSRDDFIQALNEDNIRKFLSEVSAITTGQRPDMLDDDVIDYFNNHMADNGSFKTVMRYQVPGFPNKDIDMKFKKEDYIDTVVNGRYMLEDYQTQVDIQDLKISAGGKAATFKSITKERGRMPFVKDEKSKEVTELIPIEGESICEQKLIVSFNNFIQMASADCKTVISFDPFEGKPLMPQ